MFVLHYLKCMFVAIFGGLFGSKKKAEEIVAEKSVEVKEEIKEVVDNTLTNLDKDVYKVKPLDAELDSVKKLEEVKDNSLIKEEVVEKDIIKDVSNTLEKHGYNVVGEVVLTGDEQLEIKEVVDKEHLVDDFQPTKFSKLTMGQAREIRKQKDSKQPKELALLYGVSVDTIKRILDNKTYKEK